MLTLLQVLSDQGLFPASCSCSPSVSVSSVSVVEYEFALDRLLVSSNRARGVWKLFTYREEMVMKVEHVVLDPHQVVFQHFEQSYEA